MSKTTYARLLVASETADVCYVQVGNTALMWAAHWKIPAMVSILLVVRWAQFRRLAQPVARLQYKANARLNNNDQFDALDVVSLPRPARLPAMNALWSLGSDWTCVAVRAMARHGPGRLGLLQLHVQIPGQFCVQLPMELTLFSKQLERQRQEDIALVVPPFGADLPENVVNEAQLRRQSPPVRFLSAFDCSSDSAVLM